MRRDYLEDVLTEKTLTWPSWEDLRSDRVVASGPDLEAVKSRLDRFRLCVLAGPEGSGKASLSRFIGYELLVKRQRVFHIDLAEPTGGEPLEQICLAIQKLDHDTPLYIIENIHEADDPDNLWRLIRPAFRGMRSRFLCTERTPPNTMSGEILENLEATDVEHDDVLWTLRVDAALIKRIVDKHVDRSQRQLQPPSEEEYALIAAKCGGNLRVLAAYLSVWSRGPLSELPEAEMLKSLYKKRFAALPEKIRRCLLGISAIGQFGLATAATSVEPELSRNLVRKRLIIDSKPHGYYRLPHPTDARINVEAWAAVKGLGKWDLTRDEVTNYVTAEPQPGNALAVLQRFAKAEGVHQMRPELQAAFTRAVSATVDSMPLVQIKQVLEVSADVSSSLRTSIADLIIRRGPEFLATRIRDSKKEIAGWILSHFQQFNPTFGKSLGAQISELDWRKIWLRSSRNRLLDFLHRYANEPAVHKHTNIARKVIDDLIRQEGLGRWIAGLSHEDVGKLLLIARNLGAIARPELAQAVAEHLDITRYDRPDKITLILKELWQLGEIESVVALLDRLLLSVPIQAFRSDPSGRGLAFLLYSIAKTPPTEGRNCGSLLRDALFGPPLLVPNYGWDDISLPRLLWSAILIDVQLAKEWLSSISPEELRACALRIESPQDLFFLFWNLWLINPNVSRAVFYQCDRAIDRAFWAEPSSVPLLGLVLSLFGWKHRRIRLPSPTVVAHTLMEKPDATRVVFTLRCYEALWHRGAMFLGKEIRLILKRRNVQNARELLTEHPFPEIRELLDTTVHQYV